MACCLSLLLGVQLAAVWVLLVWIEEAAGAAWEVAMESCLLWRCLLLLWCWFWEEAGFGGGRGPPRFVWGVKQGGVVPSGFWGVCCCGIP